MAPKKTTNSNRNNSPKQMPSHVGLVEKLRKRNAALEAQIKKLRGK